MLMFMMLMMKIQRGMLTYCHNNVEEFADYINEEYPNITSMFLEIIATIEDENPFLSSDEVGEQTCLTFMRF